MQYTTSENSLYIIIIRNSLKQQQQQQPTGKTRMKELRHTPGPSHSRGFLREFSANPNNETRAIPRSGEEFKSTQNSQ